MKRLLALLLAPVVATTAQAQLTITDSLTLGTVATLLEGIGVTVGNVVVQCSERAMGHFVGPSEMAITEGLVLTTGHADDVAGPVGNMASRSLGGPGDADLDLAGSMSTRDACVLEFDCVPQGDTLLFNFSFGSEEYPEFVGSAFNDLFAILLSGPGFNPPVNVAALPGGTIVSINNVNDWINPAHYYNNAQNFPGLHVAYDGFTTNLTAFAVVQPGATYHFKVAIADAADEVYDSGVFLEAFSFRSPLLTTALDELQQELHVILRPDGVHLLAPPSMPTGRPLFVVDARGALVRSTSATGATTVLPVQGLRPGLYVLHAPGTALAPVRFVLD